VQFANGDMFWLILCVPLLFMLGWRGIKSSSRQQEAFADLHLYRQLSGNFAGLCAGRKRALWQIGAAALCLVFVLLRPQWGFVWKESAKRGVDIIVAIDASDSMLADDVKPNRLIRAQRKVLDLLSHLKGDRVGLIAFSGAAFLEVPLTLDYGIFRLFMSSLSTDLIPVKGTNIESAIVESVNAFNRGAKSSSFSAAPPVNRTRALVLITDGEDFEGDLARAGALAKENKVHIYIFGIGTLEGSPIPTPGGYKQDKTGSVIISRLHEDRLEQLASETGGIYVKSITSDRDTTAIYDLGIRKTLDASSIKWGRGKRWNEYYQVPLLIALLLLILGPWGRLPELFKLGASVAEGEVLMKKASPGSVGGVLLLALCLTAGAALPAHAQTVEGLGAEAKRAYEEGKFTESLEEFTQGAEKQGSDYRFSVGQGASYYRLKFFADAKARFTDAAAKAKDKTAQAQALYNAGNSMVQLGELKEAIKAYEDSLNLVPEDKDAKDNLEYAKILLKQQQEQQQNNRQQQKQDKNAGQERNKVQNRKQDQQQSAEKEQQEKKEETKEQGKSGAAQDENKRDEQAAEEEKGKSEKEKEQQDSDKQDAGQEKKSNNGGQDEKIQQEQSEFDGERKSGEAKKAELDQTNALLNNIEEKPNVRAKHRLKKELGELDGMGKRKPPEKDW
jgi:Ca-activated chloride channel homolog